MKGKIKHYFNVLVYYFFIHVLTWQMKYLFFGTCRIIYILLYLFNLTSMRRNKFYCIMSIIHCTGV